MKPSGVHGAAMQPLSASPPRMAAEDHGRVVLDTLNRVGDNLQILVKNRIFLHTCVLGAPTEDYPAEMPARSLV